MRTSLAALARAMATGRTGISAPRARITFSVIASVLFWLITIETRTSNGSLLSAQFTTRNRHQSTSNAFRKEASSTASPFDERAHHREDIPRPLAQTSQEIREPIRPVRDVLGQAEALPHEFTLPRLADPPIHLELPESVVGSCAGAPPL